MEMAPSDDHVLAFTEMSSFGYIADYGTLYVGITTYRKRNPNTGIDSTIDFSGLPDQMTPALSDTNVSDVTFLLGVSSGGDYSLVSGWLSFQIFWIGD